MDSQIKERLTKCEPKERFNQCDILRDLKIIQHSDTNDEGEAVISETNLPYGIIINQECDLLHDFNNRTNLSSANKDKYLPSIIILPAYLSQDFRSGKHRGIDTIGQVWGTDEFKKIKQNNNIRFHFFLEDTKFETPDLIVDFKHIYTLDRKVLYKQMEKVYLASICEIYRESISQRFTNYLSRIAIPDLEQ